MDIQRNGLKDEQTFVYAKNATKNQNTSKINVNTQNKEAHEWK